MRSDAGAVSGRSALAAFYAATRPASPDTAAAVERAAHEHAARHGAAGVAALRLPADLDEATRRRAEARIQDMSDQDIRRARTASFVQAADRRHSEQDRRAFAGGGKALAAALRECAAAKAPQREAVRRTRTKGREM